ncbi:MAG TPA: ribonuclease HII [Bryobacteraceae bacterium]|jgi:ribonuclease HII|nr:ribonuclease HII [Bryobacteraceae bacterium]
MPTSRHERAFRRAGYRAIAGLDEAGRGALFGPVFAAAVILDPAKPIRGLDDSKQLAPERREVLARRIRERAHSWAVAAADAFEIDHWNILQASRLAMRRAVERLPSPCDCLLVDAVKVDLPLPQKALIHGDALCFSIAAASILAKVARDKALEAWDTVFPEYRFKENKGYGTPEHLATLERLGPTTLHRFSFEPVRNLSRSESWSGYPILQPNSEQGELFACP